MTTEAKLRELLAIYVHAHRHGNSVSNFIEDQAQDALSESTSFALASNQCHHGYGTESGDHRCKYQDQIAQLEETLELLVDHQNGCPLPKYEKEWTRAMALAQKLLSHRKEIDNEDASTTA